MVKQNNLTEGKILNALVKLAIPIIGTSFVQMAYNMTDMIWIGRMGSKAVAAVGTAGFFSWLAYAFILIPKIGAQVGVAQSVGKKDLDGAGKYITHTIQLNIFLALAYGLCLILLRRPLISFFNIGDAWTISKAASYLVIVSLGMVFYFMNPIFTAIFNGYGDSRTPFNINVVGLITNMVLDPILIFGVGPVPALGVEGAAIATIFAQFVVTMVFIYNIRGKVQIFTGINLFQKPDLKFMNSIIKLGMPVALQSGLFTLISMVIARIISNWGPIPIAVQKVGAQIESISWMSAEGFEAALGAFVGQNFGAKKWGRIHSGYYTAIGIAAATGLFSTCLLIFGARQVFSIFIQEKEAIGYGVQYLRILGLSQLFMCIEITTAGAFHGLGRTIPPSVVGVVFNALRIPAAMFLSSSTLLGLNGVWWSISVSSILKGIVLTSWFVILLKRNPGLAGKKLLKPELEI
jgi:putative MATE family efflux protein